MGKKDITQLEIQRLPETFNLTDGHAHRGLEKSELPIVERLAQLFLDAEREGQPQIERDYLTAFYTLTGQTIDEQKARYLFLPAASIGLEIVANYLRLMNFSLALTEPCFDNLANIFKRHNVALEPIPDQYLEADGFEAFLSTLQSQAICIVSPNNPTGISYSKSNFELLVRFCKEHKKLLILDASFRVYRSRKAIFDEYLLLQQSGIDYIVVEDTGKTWPSKELKVSVLAVSPRVFRPIYDIYTDFIYHHSPFTIKLLTKFIQSSIHDGLQAVQGVVARNRQVLHRAIKGTYLEPADKPYGSVAWLRITSDVRARELEVRLAQEGIFVVSGNYFFWSDKSKGDKFIRIALVRDKQIFRAAAERLREVLLTDR